MPSSSLLHKKSAHTSSLFNSSCHSLFLEQEHGAVLRFRGARPCLATYSKGTCHVVVWTAFRNIPDVSAPGIF